MKQKTVVSMLVALSSLILNGNAAITKFNDASASDSLWTNADNWTGNVPGASDQARVITGTTAILDASTSINDLLLGDLNAANDSGYVVITNGATLTLAAARSVRIAWSSTGQSGGVSLYDGSTINAAGDVELGLTASAVSAVLNVFAGTAVTMGGNLEMGLVSSTGASTVNIDGGTVDVGGVLDLKKGASIVMDNAGKLILAGDQVDVVNSMLETKIFGADSVSYDGSKTTVSAIPEPATLGMISAAGAAILFVRRFLVI
jgi:hypothetical protein